jgi:hypothetical protein
MSDVHYFLPRHLIGAWIVFVSLTFSMDLAWGATLVPLQLGFGWQASLVSATPILCAAGCLIAFLVSPVRNGSRCAIIRRLGRIPVLARYGVFGATVVVATVVGALSLQLLVLCRTQSLALPEAVSDESLRRIRDGVGEGVTFAHSNAEMRVLFLKEKRGAVEQALSKERFVEER